MLIAAFFAWWYGRGWRDQVGRVKTSLVKVNDTFSIPLLLKTLFMPFRQISADVGGRSLEEKFRAALDKLFSRLIGAFMRFFVIIAGVVVIFLLLILSVIRLLLWPLMPFLPVVGVVLMTTVGTPWI